MFHYLYIKLYFPNIFSEKSSLHDVSTCSISYLDYSNYGSCDLLTNYSNIPYVQHPDACLATSFTNRFENVFGNPNTIIRPSPVRPVLKGILY